MARLQQKKQAAVTTGSAKSSGIPCAMVLRLIRDLPGEPGFLAPIIALEVISATCRQRRGDRTTRFRRPRRHRSSARTRRALYHRVHRIPRSTCRDDRPKRPSIEAGWPDHASDFWKSQVRFRKSERAADCQAGTTANFCAWVSAIFAPSSRARGRLSATAEAIETYI